MRHGIALLLVGSGLGIGLSGCGLGSESSLRDRIAAVVAGRVSLEGPAAAELTVTDPETDRDEPLARTTSDEVGAYSLDLGPHSGSFILEADLGGAGRLRTSLDVVQGERHADVQVSPVTTLAVAWRRGAEARGIETEEAWSRAAELVFGHLGAVDHATVPPVDLRAERELEVPEGLRAGLILHGLAEQARRLSQRSRGQGAPPVRVISLVEAYARDLEDGLADGVDRFGAPVVVGGIPLTPDSLRLDLSMALAAFLDGPRNGITQRSADWSDLLRSLRESESPLFPEGSLASRDQTGPALTLGWQAEGAPIEPGAPVTGTVELVASAEDPSGVASMQVWLRRNSGTPLGEVVWQTRARWPVDTAPLADGAYEVEVEARDGLGLVSTASVALLVDHTAPTVRLEAPAQVDTPTVAITGTWFDVSGVAQVILRVEGEARVVLDDPPEDFSAIVPLGCVRGEAMTVEAVALDLAGHASAPATADVRCAGSGPSLVLLPSTFLDDRDALFSHGPDGALLGVQYPSSPRRIALDEHAVWPVRVPRLFSRLDADADNLPVFRWRASGDGPLSARFRVFVDEVEVRTWAELPVGVGGRVDLPVSYATFGASLVTAGPEAVQVAEVEVIDATGAREGRRVSLQLEALSPPVWVGGCAAAVTPAGVRLGFSAGLETPMQTAAVRWDLGLLASSQAPTGPARLRWLPDVATASIAALGEEKWHPANFTESYQPTISVPCWVSVPGAASAHEGWSGGRPLCGAGEYPAQVAEAFVAGRDGRLSQPSAIALVDTLRLGPIPLAADGRGRFLVQPSRAHTLERAATQPSLRLPDGGPYSWTTRITVPSGYATTVQAQGRARYPAPQFERAGVDYVLLGPTAGSGRPFVTRAYVQTISLSVPGPRAEADLPHLGISVPVSFDATCSASLSLEVQL